MTETVDLSNAINMIVDQLKEEPERFYALKKEDWKAGILLQAIENVVKGKYDDVLSEEERKCIVDARREMLRVKFYTQVVGTVLDTREHRTREELEDNPFSDQLVAQGMAEKLGLLSGTAKKLGLI
jgi:uncharacterized protein with GYD domain